MADNQNQRLYDDPNRMSGSEQSASGASDPLAELARLIGQSDPFGEYRRRNVQAAAPDAHWEANASRSYGGQSYDAPSYAEDAHRYQGYQSQDYRAPSDEGQLHSPTGQAYADPDYPAQNYSAQEFAAQDYPAQGQVAPDYAAQGYTPQGGYPAEDYRQPHEMPAFLNQPGFDQPAYGIEGDDAEDEDVTRRRRKVLVSSAAVMLIIVGAAGAFGYRTLSGAVNAGPPPIIKADTAPSKIVPPGQRDNAGGKAIQDRIGDRAAGERVVSREEQPVEAKPQPRVVFPAGSNVASADAANAAAAPTQSSNLTDPKRIRTIAIRPDQPVGGDPAAVAAANTARAASQTSAAPVPLPPAEPPRAAPATQAQASARGPLSLSPDAAPPAAAAAAPTRTASLPPRAASTAAPGAYVQVASQRSEADAQQSFRALQAKYPSVLGGKSASILRADLGTKGVYYRAMVGPLSGPAAVDLCGSLKAAGGSCIIQKH